MTNTHTGHATRSPNVLIVPKPTELVIKIASGIKWNKRFWLSRVSRTQAFVIYNRKHPDAFSTSYAAAVQVAGKPPTPPNPSSSKNHQEEKKSQSTVNAGASTSEQDADQANVGKLRDKYEKEALKRKAVSPTQVITDNKKSKVDQNVADEDFRKYA